MTHDGLTFSGPARANKERLLFSSATESFVYVWRGNSLCFRHHNSVLVLRRQAAGGGGDTWNQTRTGFTMASESFGKKWLFLSYFCRLKCTRVPPHQWPKHRISERVKTERKDRKRERCIFPRRQRVREREVTGDCSTTTMFSKNIFSMNSQASEFGRRRRPVKGRRDGSPPK